MGDQLGGEVIPAGVGAPLLGHVVDKDLHRLGPGDRLLHGGDLLLHGADDLLRPVLYLEDAAQIIEVLVDHVHVGPHGVAFDGGQGHDAVAAEGVVGGVVLLAERAGAAVDEVGLQGEDGLQGDVALRHGGNGLILLPPLGIDLGVVVGGGNDLVPQAQGHQLVAGVGVAGDDSLGDVGEGHLLAVLGGQSEGEAALLLGVAAGGGLGALAVRFAGARSQTHGQGHGQQGCKGLLWGFHLFFLPFFRGTKNTSLQTF